MNVIGGFLIPIRANPWPDGGLRRRYFTFRHYGMAWAESIEIRNALAVGVVELVSLGRRRGAPATCRVQSHCSTARRKYFTFFRTTPFPSAPGSRFSFM